MRRPLNAVDRAREIEQAINDRAVIDRGTRPRGILIFDHRNDHVVVARRALAAALTQAFPYPRSDIIRSEGNEAIAIAADVTSLKDVQRCVDQAVAAFGSIHILHNNVCITSQGGPVETSEEVWDRVMTVFSEQALR